MNDIFLLQETLTHFSFLLSILSNTFSIATTKTIIIHILKQNGVFV
jgi:hypothetical protein